jgi:FtsH-binding integral membrane protein
MFTIDPSQVLVNHLLWMTFIVSISVSMYTIWRYSQLRGTFNSALIMTLVIFSGLTFLTYSNPNLVSLSWGSALTTAMAVGLLAWFLPMLFADVRNMRGYYRALSAVFVFIFMLMILYDTKLLRLKAANCVVPNYPSDSLGLFLDVLNLFSGLSNSI